MALIFADRIKETTTTQGTGAYLLSGALTACRAFSSVCSVGDTVGYCAVDVDANGSPTGNWEVGIGTFGAGNTLARTEIQASSNSNAAVSWGSGNRQIFLTFTATQLANLAETSGGTYEHTQSSAATTWTINHNLGRHVVTRLFDASGKEFLGEIQNTSSNQTVVTLDTATAGYSVSI